MYNLLLKDILIQKFFFLFYIGLIVLYQVNESSFVITVSVVGTMFIINSHYYDNKGNGQMLINSLPYSRNEIILSKYIGASIFAVITTIFTLFLQWFFAKIQISNELDFGTPQTIWISFIIIMLFTAFFLPFFYRFKNKYLLTIFTLIFFMALIGWKNINKSLGIMEDIQKISIELTANEIYSVLSSITLVIFISSYFVTVKIYKKCDL
ncbi:ABC-2 transporter permease [Bacillus cereus]|uniref:ABC-2 transporter permease n=1 Tax=Bacillus cereus TaxID=1396 RepID=UPI002ABF7C63|nr:ABC-2 transporter permease [Bacillus cereus]MDZ4438675.1 ABC-2 transporter permease [Bacillus cereus]MDZ4449237.1 ABC-2 transporter permease [Bacillus cereus]MDZ4614561.1 ABC-2 transporter permease [Bacillus cereus]